MCSNRTRMYSLGVFLLGFLAICSVRSAVAHNSHNDTVASAAGIANGEKARIRGTVASVEACQLTLRGECGEETVVLVGQDTSFRVDGHKHSSLANICPGSCAKVEGRGNCAGQLVAEEIKAKSAGCEACQPACAPPPVPACPSACNPCANSH